MEENKMPADRGALTKAKIESYRSYSNGWHFGEGVAFDSVTVDAALRLHSELLRNGLSHTNAFPGLGGQVIVTFYRPPHYYEFVVYPDRHVEYTHELDDDEVCWRESITEADAYAVIAKLKTGDKE